MSEVVPAARPLLGPEEEQAVAEVLRSGQLSLGPRVPAFEQAFAARIGARHASAVSSGTAALHLALRAVGVSDGDEVVTSPFSFVASANVVLFERAKPVFADIDRRTLNIDPAAAAAAIGGRTAALLPVHIFGYPADVPALEAHGLPIVEDACEALGAVHADGTPVGGRGHPAAFGFYANKQLTTGEGGMLVMGSAEHKQRVDSERNQGRAPDMGWLDHDRLGFNYRLTDIASAIGLVQLERLDGMLADRARVAASYRAALAPLDELELPCEDAGGDRRGWFVFVVQLPHRLDRDGTLLKLRDLGIQAKPYLPAIHLMSFYRERFGHREGEFPVCEDVAARSIALPFFPEHDRRPGGPGRGSASDGLEVAHEAGAADRPRHGVAGRAADLELLEAGRLVERACGRVLQPGVERHAGQPRGRGGALGALEQRARDTAAPPLRGDRERVDVDGVARRPRRDEPGRAQVAQQPRPLPRRHARRGQRHEAAGELVAVRHREARHHARQRFAGLGDDADVEAGGVPGPRVDGAQQAAGARLGPRVGVVVRLRRQVQQTVSRIGRAWLAGPRRASSA